MDKHVCPPTWRVQREEDRDDDWEIYAHNAQSAATKWADQWDQDEHQIVAGGEEKVVVIAQDGGETIFNVTGEAIPQYYAREIRKEQNHEPN